jgi:hypothetical protein
MMLLTLGLSGFVLVRLKFLPMISGSNLAHCIDIKSELVKQAVPSGVLEFFWQ